MSGGAGLEVSRLRGGRGDFERLLLREPVVDVSRSSAPSPVLSCVGRVCDRPRMWEDLVCDEDLLGRPVALSSDADGATVDPL